MASYTLTAVRSTDFTGADGTNIETLVTWLDAFPSTSGGYYAVTTNKCKLEFSASEINGLADVTGSYTEDQYVVGRVGDLSEAGITGRYFGAFLHCTGASSAGTTASYYRLEISQDSTTTPLVTRVMRVTSGSAVQIASINNVTWANGDRFLFVDCDGTIEVYRDSGSGFGGTPILSVDDTGSRLSGGGPGLIIRTPDLHTLDDVEMGDATLSAGPTLSSATVVSTGNTIATVRVTTDTAPSGSSTLAVRTRPAANPAWTAAQVLASPTATITSGASGARDFNLTSLTNGTALIADFAQTGPSNVVSTASFTPSSGADTTQPALTGSITIGTVTSSSIQMSWPAGSDNVAVTSYEVSSNGGSSYTDVGNVLTYTFSGLTASTSYALRVRAKDAAGNVSTPALAATQSTSAAPPSGFSATIGPFSISTGSPALAAGQVLSFTAIAGNTGAGTTVINGTVTLGAGLSGVINTFPSSGVWQVNLRNADGSGRWHNVVTAA
jgi:hypothetical protein